MVNIKDYIPHRWKDEIRKGSYPWWEFNYAVEYFNNNQRNTVTAYVWDVFDNFMSAFFTQNMITGGLSCLSF